jgi:hypothetical protein
MNLIHDLQDLPELPKNPNMQKESKGSCDFQINFLGDLCHKNMTIPIIGVGPNDLDLPKNVPYELTLSFYV